ncbi:MAG: class I SAM-dependent methyltransferase [Nitrospira sp.]|nr:class I SAM-dependent methyltransferase [Nitrospira sp.]
MNKLTTAYPTWPARVGGSFRDPRGYVYRHGDRIFRTVTNAGKEQFDFVRRSGLFDLLMRDERLLPFDLIERALLPDGFDEAAPYVLEVPKLTFVSFPYEWPFPALKAAALLHLDIQLTALDHGVTLSDASAYNIQFIGAAPTFIDHLSFQRYEQGEMWAGHRQFCEQFLIPLLLRSLFGISHNAWYRGSLDGISVVEFSRLLTWRHYLKKDLLTHVLLQSLLQRSTESTLRGQDLDKTTVREGNLPVQAYRKLLTGLRRWINSLEPLQTSKSTWQDYAKENSYQADELGKKVAFVRDFAAQHRPRQLWDFGCNVGAFSKAALEGGAEYVVGFDLDQGALDECYAQARASQMPIQSVVMDMANVSPDQGWMGVEREGLGARRSADALVALAVVHHLAISRNIPFGELLDWLIDLAPCGVIEFVPKTDPMVQKLLALRADIFEDYTWDFFTDRIARRARIDRVLQVGQHGRTLVSYIRHGYEGIRREHSL